MQPLKKNLYWIPAIILATSLLLAWYGTTCGLLLTHDSHQYLAAAESFRTSFEFLGVDGKPYTYWPPLFPMVLSLVPSPATTFVFINPLLTIALFYLLFVAANRALKQVVSVFFFLAFVFLGVHLQLISVFLWSELIFVLLLAAYLSALAAEKVKWWVVYVLGFLLCLQRNAGLFVVAGSSLWIFLTGIQMRGSRFKNATALMLVCTSGLWCWNLYASFFSNSGFRFYDHGFFGSIWHNFVFISEALQHAVLPTSVGAPHFVLLTAIMFGYLFRKEWLQPTYTSLLMWTLVVYFVGMVVMFQFDPTDGDRYIAVVMPFVALLGLMAIERIVFNRKRWVRLAAAAILLVALFYPTARTIKNVAQWHQMSCVRVHNNK